MTIGGRGSGSVPRSPFAADASDSQDAQIEEAVERDEQRTIRPKDKCDRYSVKQAR